MNTVVLDFALPALTGGAGSAEDQTARRRAVHRFLARELDFPDTYGCNLDALYDLLTEGERRLELRSCGALDALGPYGRRLLDTLFDAAEHNSGLTLLIR